MGRKPIEGFDLVVVGAGVAGLSAALVSSGEGRVLVLTKGSLESSNSYAAQGGIAAALGEGDSPALHAADTLAAGRGLCRRSAVELLTDDAPARISELVDFGVKFDEGLGREGGHRRDRIVHAGGADTGRRIADVLAYLAGHLYEEEGILYALLDPERLRIARQKFDPVGHYHRPDVLKLTVNAPSAAAR